jgi:polysaccharide export outer membrane protein
MRAFGHAARSSRRLGMAVLVLALVQGCALPRSGPSRAELLAPEALAASGAALVLVDERVIAATTTAAAEGFAPAFRDAAPLSPDVVNPGDVLTLQVFENLRDQPLLSSPGQRFSLLQELAVDSAGQIFVPYAGRLPAAGRSIEDLRADIRAALDGQTPDPQVMLNRKPGDGATVTIAGAVRNQGVYPIERSSGRLSAMLARAGGAVIDPAVAMVRVARGGASGQVWLADLYADPGLDIALRPGDRLIVEQDRRAYVALGATGTQTRVPFESGDLTAIEALAQAGGLDSTLADPTGLFVLRTEPARTAAAVLQGRAGAGPQQIVYLIDLTTPQGLFDAARFAIRDRDIVYVTEAPYVQWRKALEVITGNTVAAARLEALRN